MLLLIGQCAGISIVCLVVQQAAAALSRHQPCDSTLGLQFDNGVSQFAIRERASPVAGATTVNSVSKARLRINKILELLRIPNMWLHRSERSGR